MKKKEEDIKRGKWQEISCLDKQVFIKIPKDWKRPENEVINRKFPYNSKPQEIFSDLYETKVITLNLLAKQLQESQVYPSIKEIERFINSIYPEINRKES